MRTRIGLIGAALALTACCAGCASLIHTEWSDNYALSELGAAANHPYLNDGKFSTVAETHPKEPREFTLQFPEVKRIRRIKIENDNLHRFRIDYWDPRREKWETLETVWQRRDVEGLERQIQPRFDIRNINIQTDKLRVTASRTADDRIITKPAPEPGDIVIDHRRDVVAGRLLEYYRIIIESTARLREIQAFGIQPNR